MIVIPFTEDRSCPICHQQLIDDCFTHMGNDWNICGQQVCRSCFDTHLNNIMGMECPNCQGKLNQDNLVRQFVVEYRFEDDENQPPLIITVGVPLRDAVGWDPGIARDTVGWLVNRATQREYTLSELGLVYDCADGQAPCRCIFGQRVKCYVGRNGQPPTRLTQIDQLINSLIN